MVDWCLVESRHLPTPEAPATRLSSADSSQPNPDVPSETETAAGHKRDVLPEEKVVTAATVSVGPSPASVNQATGTSAGSVDYAFLRDQITIEQVLSHLGYLDGLRGSGEERRGPCPLHDSAGQGKPDFSANLRKNVFHCFHRDCGQAGNVLDFWAAVHSLSSYKAALHLADTFDLQIQPEQRRGARNMNQKPK